MTATVDASATTRARALADLFIAFLETGELPDGLFAPDVFSDVTVPTWRLQGRGPEALRAIRQGGHPCRGQVPRHRLDPTPTGFVLEFEETWTDAGGRWYSREMARADVSPAGITALSVYCTGDWDEVRVAEHAAAVSLLVP